MKYWWHALLFWYKYLTLYNIDLLPFSFWIRKGWIITFHTNVKTYIDYRYSILHCTPFFLHRSEQSCAYILLLRCLSIYSMASSYVPLKFPTLCWKLNFSYNPRSDSWQLTTSFQYAFATVFAIISPTVYTSKIMNILLFIFFLKIKSSVKFSLDRKRNCIYWSIIKDTVAFSLYVLFRSGLSLNCSTYPTLHEPVPLNG